MIAHHATVLNHDLARGLALLRGLIVPNSKLHPDDSRGRLDRLVHDRRYGRRRTEDVDGVEGNRDGVERWIRFLPEDLRRSRVHGDDAVAVHLHVLRDPVRVLGWIFRATDDRDRPDLAQDFPDLCLVDHGVLGRTCASELRFLREDAANRCVEARREIQAFRFLPVEPPNLPMLFVRNLRLPIPLGDEEQVVPEEVLRSRIDVFIDAEEPRPERRDPQLLFELADQGGRRLFARDEMSPEGIPHAREPNHASAPTEEDPTVASDQPRRGDVNHTGIMDVLRYSFFFEDRDDGHPPSPPKDSWVDSRLMARWRRLLKRLRSACARLRSSASRRTSIQT